MEEYRQFVERTSTVVGRDKAILCPIFANELHGLRSFASSSDSPPDFVNLVSTVGAQVVPLRRPFDQWDQLEGDLLDTIVAKLRSPTLRPAGAQVAASETTSGWGGVLLAGVLVLGLIGFCSDRGEDGGSSNLGSSTEDGAPAPTASQIAQPQSGSAGLVALTSDLAQRHRVPARCGQSYIAQIGSIDYGAGAEAALTSLLTSFPSASFVDTALRAPAFGPRTIALSSTLQSTDRLRRLEPVAKPFY